MLHRERDPLTGQDRGADRGHVAARLDHESEVGAEFVDPTEPAASAAVVMTEVAPRMSATRRASTFHAGVAAEDRDREPQRLVHAYHAGILILPGDQRRGDPDGRADGEKGDDRVALGEGQRDGGGGGSS